MADFVKAYAVAMKNEGGYSNHPKDPGGETYKGIARRYFPAWAGWKIVDQYKPLKTGAVIKNAALDQLVKDHYFDVFWIQQAKGNKLTNQAVANFILDSVINHGEAEKWIVNDAVNKALARIKINDTVPMMHSISEKAVNYLNKYPADIYPVLLSEREQYYRGLANFGTFGKGWLARLASFPKSIGTTAAAGLGILVFAAAVFF